jgi:type II secretory pathway pseudopilin PulG
MTDQITIRFVVILLGMLAAAATGGAILLQRWGDDAAQAWQLAGTFGGALAAMLAQTKTASDPATSEALTRLEEQAREAGAAVEQAAATRWIAQGMPPVTIPPGPGDGAE